jgi:DNA-binding MarR family transcriptional regulator
LPTLLLSLVGPRSHQIVLEAFGDAQTRTDYALLAGLAEFGPLSQADLARRIGFDRSDMVALLRDLEKRGLADRQPDTTDRRRSSVTITPSGTRRLGELDRDAEEAHQRLLEPLSSAERRQLTSILQQLLVHHSDFSPPKP